MFKTLDLLVYVTSEHLPGHVTLFFILKTGSLSMIYLSYLYCAFTVQWLRYVF